MGPQFFETKMGRMFYDSTMPRIAKALERIADKLDEKASDAETTIDDLLAALVALTEEGDPRGVQMARKAIARARAQKGGPTSPRSSSTS